LGLGALALAISVAVVTLHLANGDIPFRDDFASHALGVAVGSLLYAVLGAVILRRHRRHPIGLLILTLGLSAGFAAVCREYALLAADGGALLPGSSWAWWFGSFLWFPGFAIQATLLLVIFPDGRPWSRAWWPLAIAAGALVAVDTAWFAVTPFDLDLPSELAGLSHPLGISGQIQRFEEVFPPLPLVYLAVTLLCLAALAYRLVSSAGVTRLQVGWFALGSLLWVVAAAVDAVYNYTDRWTFAETFFISLPVIGAAIGIVRHDLYDIRRVVHRASVLIAFAVGAAAVYAGVILFAGWWVGRPRDDVWSAGMAVALIAAAALPALRWIDRAADRLLFGDRAEPLAVLSRLSGELDAAQDPTTALTLAARAIAESLRLPFVGIEADGLDPVKVGDRQLDGEAIPLTFRGIRVGTLLLGARAVGEAFDTGERRLLADMAQRLGATVHAVQLTADLRVSREQLVLAREEERRRIRHDLHDGLGPQLAGVGLQLDLSREFLQRDPCQVAEMLTRAKDELDGAIVGIRQLVDGLRPPALDELGLVGAIRQQVRSLDASLTDGLVVTVDAPDDLGALPAAVEVAAFRIATESATNASRHSGARRCDIALRRDGTLDVLVHDDGKGVDADAPPGVGLTSMRRRAEELGGTFIVESSPATGTRVEARLPLP
jgi:signal transduction histidine kinase